MRGQGAVVSTADPTSEPAAGGPGVLRERVYQAIGMSTGFGFGGGVRYVGSSFADTANTARVPGVVLGDLALHYEWDNNWRAALNVVNVTDKIYVASCATIGSCYYGDRRRITASLAYKW